MNRYTIYCTEAQTRKVLELGAPLNWNYHKDDFENSVKIKSLFYAEIPTAEQLIGYLEEKHSLQFLTGIDDEDKFFFNVYHAEGYIEVRGCNSRKEATIAAIDAALEYLTKNKK